MISDKAVEAAAKAESESDRPGMREHESENFKNALRRDARMHLDAAAPHMLAQAKAAALEEAADAAEGMHDPVATDCKEWADWLRARAKRALNPYRSQP